jgi:hypothetical protein
VIPLTAHSIAIVVFSFSHETNFIILPLSLSRLPMPTEYSVVCKPLIPPCRDIRLIPHTQTTNILSMDEITKNICQYNLDNLKLSLIHRTRY